VEKIQLNKLSAVLKKNNYLYSLFKENKIKLLILNFNYKFNLNNLKIILDFAVSTFNATTVKLQFFLTCNIFIELQFFDKHVIFLSYICELMMPVVVYVF